MTQEWFEMTQRRKRQLDTSAWIPLRAKVYTERQGSYGDLDFKEDYFGAGSLAIPLEQRALAETIGWGDIGINRLHSAHVDDDGRYCPSDTYHARSGLVGTFLVLEQYYDSGETTEWYLHPDLVIALGLKRENDVWVCPEMGYLDVVRMERNDEGVPMRIDIRSSFLKDYLCARQMALRISSYRQRAEISESRNHIAWSSNPLKDVTNGNHWEGEVREIHEGSGMAYGSKVQVVVASRVDVDSEADVPIISASDPIQSASFERAVTSSKLYYVRGELWKDEWIEPGTISPIIKRDTPPPSAFFRADAAGTLKSRNDLVASASWLWFRPSVVDAMLSYRGSFLRWFSRDTGSVACSPRRGVHFGVNSSALLNVFAKDIIELPDWQQQVWAAHNVLPEGGVSEELFSAQMFNDPAPTKAPETLLLCSMEELNRVSLELFGFPILRDHDYTSELLPRVNRFRVLNFSKLLELAKDIARLIADRVDTKAIKALLPADPTNDKLGSLKTLERLVATKIDRDQAGKILGPLFATQDLRNADAHMPPGCLAVELALVGIDEKAPFLSQGFELINSCANALIRINEALGA